MKYKTYPNILTYFTVSTQEGIMAETLKLRE